MNLFKDHIGFLHSNNSVDYESGVIRFSVANDQNVKIVANEAKIWKSACPGNDSRAWQSAGITMPAL